MTITSLSSCWKANWQVTPPQQSTSNLELTHFQLKTIWFWGIQPHKVHIPFIRVLTASSASAIEPPFSWENTLVRWREQQDLSLKKNYTAKCRMRYTFVSFFPVLLQTQNMLKKLREKSFAQYLICQRDHNILWRFWRERQAVFFSILGECHIYTPGFSTRPVT